MGRVVWIDFKQAPAMAPTGSDSVSAAFTAAGKSLAYDFTSKSWVPKAADALRPLLNQQSPQLASKWSAELDVPNPPTDAGTIMVDVVHSRLGVILSEPIDFTPIPSPGQVAGGSVTVGVNVSVSK